MMSPSHFTDTAVGGSAAGASKGGLTALGREWVKRMEARGMLIDVGVVGAAHVGLGSDFDGAVTEPFDPSGLALITEALLQQGLSEHDIQLVMGENVARVLGQILPE
jgi:microsomal dipeptidase-like Zn-dependent dipeptidase